MSREAGARGLVGEPQGLACPHQELALPGREEAVETFPLSLSTESGCAEKAAFQENVGLAATLLGPLGLPARGPRGREAFFTGHVCGRTGAEALATAGVDGREHGYAPLP